MRTKLIRFAPSRLGRRPGNSPGHRRDRYADDFV